MSGSTSKRILPGATLGVFGGGQLGRMFTHAAQRLGYHVVVFTDEDNGPAVQVADASVVGSYQDPEAVRRFAQQVEVITLEFENIHLEAVQRAAEFAPVRPGTGILAVAQHRLREKRTLQDLGFCVTPFRELRNYQEIPQVAEELGWPMVLKTASWGYDGKGQRLVHSMIEANDALELLGPEPVIAEKWISYSAEVSVLAARNPDGQIAVYPMFTNRHVHHILDLTTCPASIELSGVAAHAEAVAKSVAESMQLEGLLCIEFFVGADGELMINELAPRPHNSGHLTIEASRTSQFEQQVRAVCNLPLGETDWIQPAAMVNLLGDIWGTQHPNFVQAFAEPRAHLHLYGKRDARQGRKMGHLTVLDESSQTAADRALSLRDHLSAGPGQLF